MANDRFSRRGNPPTDFELRLLQTAAEESAWLDIARQLMADLGTEAGARALLVVLDALGSEKVHVPRREHLFRSLYRAERDEEIVARLDRPGETVTSVARAMNVHPVRVCQVVKRSGRRYSRRVVGRRS